MPCQDVVHKVKIHPFLYLFVRPSFGRQFVIRVDGCCANCVVALASLPSGHTTRKQRHYDVRSLIPNSLKFVLVSPIDNKSTVVQSHRWSSSPTHICGTRGRWVSGKERQKLLSLYDPTRYISFMTTEIWFHKWLQEIKGYATCDVTRAHTAGIVGLLAQYGDRGRGQHWL